MNHSERQSIALFSLTMATDLMRFSTLVLASAFLILLVPSPSSAEDSTSLMEQIAPWRYPEASMQGMSMSDAATVDVDGNRTVPSVVCNATMKTADSVDDVVAYYQRKLTPNRDAPEKEKEKDAWKEGRSVLVFDESEDRPFGLRVILVNAGNTSTTLLISRGQNEKQTHITWKRYLKFDVPIQQE